MSSASFASPPPAQTYAIPSFPSPGVLLVTFNRPKSLNCVNIASSWELDALFQWFDNEPSLRVAVVTGAHRAFCAGADLKGRLCCSSFWVSLTRVGHQLPAHSTAQLTADF